MGYFVPDELRRRAQWVVHRDKVPHIADGSGRKASTVNPATWSDYETAVTAAAHGDFDGLGFVFTSEDDLVFIDLDNVIDRISGEYNPLSMEILGMFPESYAEVSQSERGLHIVCKGSLQRVVKRREIEIYSKGRFMAFTGNAIACKEPAHAQTALNALVSRFGVQEGNSSASTSKTAYSGTQDEETTLARIQRSKVASEFASLFNGEWDGMQKSHSEADFRLIWLLWFFSGGNEAVTHDLFMHSALAQRGKATRPDYFTRTLEAVKRMPWKPQKPRTGVSRFDKYKPTSESRTQAERKENANTGKRRGVRFAVHK